MRAHTRCYCLGLQFALYSIVSKWLPLTSGCIRSICGPSEDNRASRALETAFRSASHPIPPLPSASFLPSLLRSEDEKAVTEDSCRIENIDIMFLIPAYSSCLCCCVYPNASTAVCEASRHPTENSRTTESHYYLSCLLLLLIVTKYFAQRWENVSNHVPFPRISGNSYAR